jgi:pimeloyl-ACP methyl ester carboxylesterase
VTFVATKDGTQIFYKDWGPKSAQSLVFHHGWPLSSDDWTRNCFSSSHKASVSSLTPATTLDASERRSRHGPLRSRCLCRGRVSQSKERR